MFRKNCEKATCKWTFILNFKQLWHFPISSPSYKYTNVSLKQSYKTPVKWDFRKIILFKSYLHLKLYIYSLCIIREVNISEVNRNYWVKGNFIDKKVVIPCVTIPCLLQFYSKI